MNKHEVIWTVTVQWWSPVKPATGSESGHKGTIRLFRLTLSFCVQMLFQMPKANNQWCKYKSTVWKIMICKNILFMPNLRRCFINHSNIGVRKSRDCSEQHGFVKDWHECVIWLNSGHNQSFLSSHKTWKQSEVHKRTVLSGADRLWVESLRHQ